MTKISTITAGNTNRKRSCRPHLMLEFAAPFQMYAFGQWHLLGDDSLGLVDEADNVAAADIQRDVIQQPAVFALDHRRPFDDLHVGHSTERNEWLPLDGVSGTCSVIGSSVVDFRGVVGHFR